MARRLRLPRLSRAAVTLAAFGALMAAAAGCIDERDRLDVPDLTLVLDDTAVAPSGEITGRVVATDASGLVRYRVMPLSDYLKNVRVSRNLNDVRQIDTTFRLAVADTIPVGTEVPVEATVFDNQGFVVGRTDTVRIVTP
jgi:hypothetical protein